MADDKQPMQADGAGTKDDGGTHPGTTGAGESGGGAYPNPHSGKAPKDGLLGHGGQTEITEKAPGERAGKVGKG